MPKILISNVSENGEKLRVVSGNGNLNEVLKPGEERVVEDSQALLVSTANDDGVGEAEDDDAGDDQATEGEGAGAEEAAEEEKPKDE